MIYRSATIEDAEAISALILSFQPDFTLDASGRGAESFLSLVTPEAERSYLASERYHYLVAERPQGKLAGVIAIRDQTHIFHLFVATEFQRQGLARALWIRVQRMLSADASSVDFTVNSTLAAAPVYTRLGFEQVKPEVHEHGIAYVPMRLRRGGMPPNSALQRTGEA